LLGAAIVWHHSYWAAKSLVWRSERAGPKLISYRSVVLSSVLGGVAIRWHFAEVAATPRAIDNLSDFRQYHPETLAVVCDPIDANARKWAYFGSLDKSRPLGFQFSAWSRQQPQSHDWVLSVPYWFVFVLSAIPTIGRLGARARIGLRRRQGRCIRCGYDLSYASGDQCPECGPLRGGKRNRGES
jgi:hypothetical protein